MYLGVKQQHRLRRAPLKWLALIMSIQSILTAQGHLENHSILVNILLAKVNPWQDVSLMTNFFSVSKNEKVITESAR